MRLALLAALLLLPSSLASQQPDSTARHDDHDMAVQGGGQFPAPWQVRTDEGAPAGVKFDIMEPGFHLTMGPAAILWRPDDKASGDFHTVALIHLFPRAKHAEGFGIFIGGQDLAGAGQQYTYFLIRGDGTYLVKRRQGASTSNVTKGWTPDAAIKKSDGKNPVANELSLLVKGGKVSFMVNGKEVFSAPAASLDTRGIVGLRVNHNLSVHVEKFEVHRQS